jgi:hypothetical protein
MARSAIRALACGAACAALLAAPAGATLRIQAEAVQAGYPAGNCSYCHTFDTDHMKATAGKQRLPAARGTDCYACHGSRLPKKGTWLLNDRGLHLVRTKEHLRAERVTTEWLSSYREPKPARPREDRRQR